MDSATWEHFTPVSWDHAVPIFTAMMDHANVLWLKRKCNALTDISNSHISTLFTSTDTSSKSPYFVEYAKRDLEKNLGPSQLYKGGLNIYSTLSYKMQSAAEDAVQKGLADLESRMKRQNVPVTALQAALIALQVDSGAILAMVGGKDYYESSYNRATMAKRQPGSAFKPIIYALAVEHGFSQNQMVLDAPVAFRNTSFQDAWQPQNFSRTYSGEITFREALAKSKNIPAVRLIQMLGPSAVVEFAHTMGISSVLPPELSLALGTAEVSLLDLTCTYSVFPNRGRAIKPFSIMAVDDSRGRTIWHPKPEKKAVMSEAGAAIVTDMLMAVVQEGTGRKAQMLQKPVAGKTGTTDDFRDAFFIGFSPGITVGVWVGQDGSETLGKGETGARAALPIWTAFMSVVLEDRPYQHFGIPDGVSQVRMDPRTGTITSDDTPGAVTILVGKQ